MHFRDKDPLNLIIAGVGGQGNMLISGLIGRALLKKGYFIVIGELHGSSQRGGAVMSHVRISIESEFSPIIPNGQADVVLGLEPVETLRILGVYGNPTVDVITNTRPLYPIAVSSGEAEYPSLDQIKKSVNELSHKAWFINASDIALDLETAILTNIVMVGALVASELIPLSQEAFLKELKESMSPSRLEVNLRAFKKGINAFTTNCFS
ncbi:indolepyruvate oxidoreductase subunit beta [Chloroflexota bacterium]